MRTCSVQRLWCAVVVFAGLAASAGAGPLDPPPGPVAPTMKTLEQVEPRTPIGPDTTPGDAAYLYIISAPGSYYLTGDINVTTHGIAIFIDASHVTLDMMGFSIVAPSGPLLSSNGIAVSSADGVYPSDVVVRNGRIRGWERGGVFLRGEDSRAEDLTVEDCGSSGVIVGRRGIVVRCQARDCGSGIIGAEGGLRCSDSLAENCPSNGFSFGPDSVLERCIALGCGSGFNISGGTGATLRDCRANGSTTIGFRLGLSESDVLVGCTSRGNMEQGFQLAPGTTARDCTASGNGLAGFDAAAGSILHGCSSDTNATGFLLADDCAAHGCTARQNTGAGFDAAQGVTLTACTAAANMADGFITARGSSLEACTAKGNSGDGFDLAGRQRVAGCSAVDNTGWGLRVLADSLVIECLASSNDMGGIHATDHCVVRGNNCAQNGVSMMTVAPGIQITSHYNRVEGNSCTENTGPAIVIDGNRNMVLKNDSALNGGTFDNNGTSNRVPVSNDITTAGPWDNHNH